MHTAIIGHMSCSLLLKFFFVRSHLDLPEVHRLADQLVVLGQLLARRQPDEDFTQLSPITAETSREWSQNVTI